MLDIAVIIASTREGRFGTAVGRWFLAEAGRRGDLGLDVIDLSRTPLPPLQPAHAGGTSDTGGIGGAGGTDEIGGAGGADGADGADGAGESSGANGTDDAGGAARALAARIGAADGFVVITPEYNHGYPAALKLAIDAVRWEWAAKPVCFISYGGMSGGLRAVEQLRLVFAELHTVTLRDTVSFHGTQGRFDENGDLTDPSGPSAAVKVMLDQLVWWGTTLREARAARPYRV
ncbi:NAD(P)H-dependent FMN reductase [Streptosporangium becharense]|uniref:NAD(P)H-dependent FMN reductase n=1 Tax=Streptosporangium becharense TaxID=1816182 RepID=A0A7W9IHA0_9ACTN|nr:NAD(P)H-dependent oxidoreductase [Streptosporangium becharense]MBB2912625.1 NAD(P)H-dependent FMN reductase [Streptosporangium becharense]MBB5820546.1 NAD(P)H-dependent FMN reductase [Streptosporangium becharense]